MTLGASRVELRVSCHGLLDRDTLTKPHPCVLPKLHSDEQWVEVRVAGLSFNGPPGLKGRRLGGAAPGMVRTLGLFQSVGNPRDAGAIAYTHAKHFTWAKAHRVLWGPEMARAKAVALLPKYESP